MEAEPKVKAVDAVTWDWALLVTELKKVLVPSPKAYGITVGCVEAVITPLFNFGVSALNRNRREIKVVVL